MHACKIPNGRCAQTQMRVIGQQRFAADSMAARHHPVVAALAFNVAYFAANDVGSYIASRFLFCYRFSSIIGNIHAGYSLIFYKFLASCLDFGRFEHTQIGIEFGQIHFGNRRITRIGREQIPHLFGWQFLCCGQAPKFCAPVTAQIQRHHDRPTHTVNTRPRGRFYSQHMKLGW